MTVHVVPVNDSVEHDLYPTFRVDEDCVCLPDLNTWDDDRMAPYSSGPLVVHHSLDGRERGPAPEGDGWQVVEVQEP